MLILTQVTPYIEIIDVIDYNTCINSITDTYGKYVPATFIYDVMVEHPKFIVPDYKPYEFELYPYTSTPYILKDYGIEALKKYLLSYDDTYYIVREFSTNLGSLLMQLYEPEDTCLGHEINVQLRKFMIDDIIKDIC